MPNKFGERNFGEVTNLQTGFCKLELAKNLPKNPEVYKLTDEGEFRLVGVALDYDPIFDGFKIRLLDGSERNMFLSDNLWVSKDYRHVPFKRST